MTREELLNLVNGKTDTSKFTSLSQKTINEELDDVLDEMGDDESANDKVVTKLANRLKRMDGNLHKNVSDEMKKNREEAERKKREADEARKRNEEGDQSDDKVKALEEKLDRLLAANEERDRREAKKAVVASVKSGLKDKFDKAKLEINDFFLETALSKLDIPEKDADIQDLVSRAESIYTSDYKRANGGSAVPHKGSFDTKPEEKIDEHEWDDIKDATAKK